MSNDDLLTIREILFMNYLKKKLFTKHGLHLNRFFEWILSKSIVSCVTDSPSDDGRLFSESLSSCETNSKIMHKENKLVVGANYCVQCIRNKILYFE